MNQMMRQWMQGEHLTFLTAVAATLPREQSPTLPRVCGRSAGFREPAVAVCQQGTGDLGQTQREKREDKQLIPEEMPTICLSV